MHKIIFALTLVSIISVTAFTEQTNPSTSDPKARAQEVLKQARAALWEETKKPLQSLSITASSRRSMGQMQMASELTLDILMPDKFLRTEVSDFGTNIQAINGTQTWSDFKRNEMAGGFGGGGNVVIAGGGGDGVFTRQVGGGGPGGGGGGGPVMIGGPGGGPVMMGGNGQTRPGAPMIPPDFGRLLIS